MNILEKQQANSVYIGVVRQHSLYSLVHDSSDELKMCPTRKKTDIRLMEFFFFPPTWLKSHSRDLWNKEYSECCLINITCKSEGKLFTYH